MSSYNGTMRKEALSGLAGFFGLLFFYFLVMILASRSWSATIFQFKELWYWMILLASGFGLQIGLFTHFKNLVKNPQMFHGSEAIAASSTGTSAVSMVVCCAHHLTEFLPIIGLSGFTIFLIRYQISLIIFGIIMNGFGIFYMWKQINKVKNFYDKNK